MNNNMLPEGLTPDMLQAIAAFMQQQQSAIAAARPVGTLQPNQIRGVNPAYKYRFREYPKALNPPPVTVEDEKQERTLRARWNQSLPWNDAAMVEGYYAEQSYPREMQPPQIVVQSPEEEESVLASWGDYANRVHYPRWMFHASEEATMVRSHDEEIALGAGWFPTIKEAIAMAQAAARTNTGNDERSRLMDRAHQMGVVFKPQWSTDRIREAVEAVEKEQAAA